MHKILLLVIMVFILLTGLAVAGKLATTDDGKKVMLNNDGTWKYIHKSKIEADNIVKPKNNYVENSKISILNGKAVVNYNSMIWRSLKEEEPGVYTLIHKNGDAYAKVIVERIQMTSDELRDVVLNNGRKMDPGYHITDKNDFIINGQLVSFMRTTGKINGLNFVAIGNYYAGDIGTIQIVTYTSVAGKLLYEYYGDMKNFIDGFEILQ